MDNQLVTFKRLASTQYNIYLSEISQNVSDSEQAQQMIERLSKSWNGVQNQAKEIIKMIADSNEQKANDDSKETTLSPMFNLLEYKENAVKEYEEGEIEYSALLSSQNAAIDTQKQIKQIEQDLLEMKTKYNNVVMGVDDTSNEKPSNETDLPQSLDTLEKQNNSTVEEK